jgi:hypothetical protein
MEYKLLVPVRTTAARRWTDLSWAVLLDMLEPLGIEHVRVDPVPDGRPQADNSPRPLLPLARPAALRGSRHGPGPQCEQRPGSGR